MGREHLRDLRLRCEDHFKDEKFSKMALYCRAYDGDEISGSVTTGNILNYFRLLAEYSARWMQYMCDSCVGGCEGR
jgi:hypothetical protein